MQKKEIRIIIDGRFYENVSWWKSGQIYLVITQNDFKEKETIWEILYCTKLVKDRINGWYMIL
jgi:hypothetical protein